MFPHRGLRVKIFRRQSKKVSYAFLVSFTTATFTFHLNLHFLFSIVTMLNSVRSEYSAPKHTYFYRDAEGILIYLYYFPLLLNHRIMFMPKNKFIIISIHIWSLDGVKNQLRVLVTLISKPVPSKLYL